MIFLKGESREYNTHVIRMEVIFVHEIIVVVVVVVVVVFVVVGIKMMMMTMMA